MAQSISKKMSISQGKKIKNEREKKDKSAYFRYNKELLLSGSTVVTDINLFINLFSMNS